MKTCTYKILRIRIEFSRIINNSIYIQSRLDRPYADLIRDVRDELWVLSNDLLSVNELQVRLRKPMINLQGIGLI